MASAFSRFRGDIEDDLEAQVAKLSKELASVRKAMARTMASRGSDAYGDAREAASDIYSEMHGRLVHAMPSIRKQARAAERAARNNPGVTAAAVGLAVAGLLVMMMARR